MILDQIRELLKNTPIDAVPEEIIIGKLDDEKGFRLAHVPAGHAITNWKHIKCETVSKEERSVIDHSEVKGDITFTSYKVKDDATLI
jgi:hypothetical protein